MENKQNNASPGNGANCIVNEIANLSVASPDTVLETQSASNNSADPALSLVHETENPTSTSSTQSPPYRPLWNTREGRIAGYKRMIEKNNRPEHRANLEALVHYYEEGGKVPEGEEEVWATEGQVSFRSRGYKSIEEMPEGLLFKLNYYDVSRFFCLYQFLFWPT